MDSICAITTLEAAWNLQSSRFIANAIVRRTHAGFTGY